MYNIDYYCYTYRLMMPVQLVSALYQKRVINYLFIYLFINTLRASLKLKLQLFRAQYLSLVQ